MCYEEQKVIVLGIGNNLGNHLIEFNYDIMQITKSVETSQRVHHIEKVKDDTFIIGYRNWIIEIRSKNNLSLLSKLELNWNQTII